jgi:hypothetical protein
MTRRVNNVFILSMDTQDSNINSTSGAQYQYVQQQLSLADADNSIDWIFVIMHKPIFGLSASHAPLTAVRTTYQPLFDQFHVDFVLHGHNHNTQISKPMNNGQTPLGTKLSSGTYDFRQTHGQVYMVLGGGGASLDSTGSSLPSYMEFMNGSEFAYGYWTIDETGLNITFQVIDINNAILFTSKYTKSQNPSGGGGSGGGGTNPPPPTGGSMDSNGILWLYATGQQDVVEQSRNESTDKRWSDNRTNVLGGYEVTAIVEHFGVNSSSHMALKHWGPNHSGSCGHTESGSCCCWYDTGIRVNGNVQTQIERPHPSNDDWPCPQCTTDNVGVAMGEGKFIGLKWYIHPVIPGGSANNGGIHLMMWCDNDALLGTGLPRNNWVLIYDIIDSGQILGDYEAPSEHDIEMRISDTDSVDVYGGGLHFRRRT